MGMWHASRDNGQGDDLCPCDTQCTEVVRDSAEGCCMGDTCHAEYGDGSSCMVGVRERGALGC